MTAVRVCLVLMWLTVVSGAKAADGPTAPDKAAERTRINQQRALLEADFAKMQQECHARFAVSDCVRQTSRERRVALDGLRRQELMLNQRDRQSRALADLERIQGNVSREKPSIVTP